MARVGTVLSLLNGLWAAYVSLNLMDTLTSCPSGGCPATPAAYLPTILLAVAVVLVVDSLVSFGGFRVSFLVGAALSATTLILVVAQWSSFTGYAAYLSASLSVVAVIVDLSASRHRKWISEQDHPLNLPVFG